MPYSGQQNNAEFSYNNSRQQEYDVANQREQVYSLQSLLQNDISNTSRIARFNSRKQCLVTAYRSEMPVTRRLVGGKLAPKPPVRNRR